MINCLQLVILTTTSCKCSDLSSLYRLIKINQLVGFSLKAKQHLNSFIFSSFFFPYVLYSIQALNWKGFLIPVGKITIWILYASLHIFPILRVCPQQKFPWSLLNIIYEELQFNIWWKLHIFNRNAHYNCLP